MLRVGRTLGVLCSEHQNPPAVSKRVRQLIMFMYNLVDCEIFEIIYGVICLVFLVCNVFNPNHIFRVILDERATYLECPAAPNTKGKFLFWF